MPPALCNWCWLTFFPLLSNHLMLQGFLYGFCHFPWLLFTGYHPAVSPHSASPHLLSFLPYSLLNTILWLLSNRIRYLRYLNSRAIHRLNLPACFQERPLKPAWNASASWDSPVPLNSYCICLPWPCHHSILHALPYLFFFLLFNF
jgi:hypothetical protein